MKLNVANIYGIEMEKDMRSLTVIEISMKDCWSICVLLSGHDYCIKREIFTHAMQVWISDLRTIFEMVRDREQFVFETVDWSSKFSKCSFSTITKH